MSWSTAAVPPAPRTPMDRPQTWVRVELVRARGAASARRRRCRRPVRGTGINRVLNMPSACKKPIWEVIV